MEHQYNKTIEEIEQELYEALMREVPSLQPFVARGLARKAADKFRFHGIGGQKLPTAHDIAHLNRPRQFPDDQTKQDHENDPSKPQ